MSGTGGGNGGGIVGNLPTGVKLAAIALLVHSLMKHARPEQAGAGAAPESSGGGLGGILGSVFGQGASPPPPKAVPVTPGAAAPAADDGGFLSGLLVGPVLGGLGGLLGSLRQHGMGQKVDSWVAPGQNQPVSPHELESAFAPGELDEAARRAGTDRGTLLQELSQMLPKVVDGMTPGGRIPQREEEVGGIGGLLGRLLGGADRGSEPRR